MSLVSKLRPLADRLLVKRLLPVTQTAGGVFLPETSQSKNNEGEVVAVGPGRRDGEGSLLPMDLAVGDKVLLPEYGGTSVKLDDEDYFLFRNDDILAKLEQ